MTPILIFCVVFGLAILLAVVALSSKKNKQNTEELKIIAELKRLFGHRIIPHRGIASAPQFAAKWYAELRITSQYDRSEDDYVGSTACSDVVLKDHTEKYWHVLLRANSKSNDVSVVTTQLDELRARRALFNDPANYVKAFGQAPHRDQIKAVTQRNQKDKLAQFDTNIHGGEIMAVKAIGQEFNATKI